MPVTMIVCLRGVMDDSNFSNIFDVDWFIRSVAPDVKLIKELPQKERTYLLKQMSSRRVPRKVSPHYYLTRILPTLKRRHVMASLRSFLFLIPGSSNYQCYLATLLSDHDFHLYIHILHFFWWHLSRLTLIGCIVVRICWSRPIAF